MLFLLAHAAWSSVPASLMAIDTLPIAAWPESILGAAPVAYGEAGTVVASNISAETVKLALSVITV
ncbi:hypothetical protein D3C80_1471020 [compost metagenome]